MASAPTKKPDRKRQSAITGAAFLMATSAIGPGFLTQTSLFTAELLASFGFVILISLLLDLGAQLNIWRILSFSNKRAQDLSNEIYPGLGVLLAFLIGFGGLAFNVGNIGGTGLGLNALAGIDTRAGAVFSAGLAIFIFWYKEPGKLMDLLVKWLGIAMIIFTLYIAVSSGPPVGEAVFRTFWPERTDSLTIITLVGGTVGGYISFAGAHRLIDAGITGSSNLKEVSGSAVRGIAVTTVMRYILFLAVLGVVSAGLSLDAANPAASVFSHAAGEVGLRFFGLVMWCAAVTSVIGASFTSISFFRSLHPFIERRNREIVTVFILLSLSVFLFVGKPVSLLVLAGAINGLILPLALSLVLAASRNRKIVGNYRSPLWLELAGWLVVFALAWLGYESLASNIGKLFG